MISAFLLFFMLHAFVWFSTIYQLTEAVTHQKALIICMALSIPTSLLSFYATKAAYEVLGTAWSIKLFGFGLGYLVFPFLTWIFLKESPYNLKTITCIILSFTIVAIQVFVPDN